MTKRQSSGSLRAYYITVLLIWIAGLLAGFLYVRQQKIPPFLWMAAIPALLVEASFYIAPGFGAVRQRLSGLRRGLVPLLLITAIIPYLILGIGLGNFRLESLVILLVIAATVLVWYHLLPRGPVYDLLFLFLMAGVYLSGAFPSIYINPLQKPALDILGRLMWIRVGVCAVLLIRGGAENVEYGFLPTAKDWRIGALYFFYSIFLIAPVALGIGFVHLRTVSFDLRTLLTAVGTFLGMLWVVAMAEEFFFRGMLQQILQSLTGSLIVGLALTSVFFGISHLPMRGFPNWKFALCATIAGIFYGLSYMRGKSIRSSMVTHALVNTAWRVFFT